MVFENDNLLGLVQGLSQSNEEKMKGKGSTDCKQAKEKARQATEYKKSCQGISKIKE
jgi:hypothetical protein